MKSALVTGITGFTGGYLARRLVQEGIHVRGLVLPEDRKKDIDPGIEVVIGDLRDKSALVSAVKGIDRVFHIAAVYREENIPKHIFWDVNVDGTRNLLEVAKAAEIKRFIHCSTVGVQGEIKDPPATEETPYNPGDYYQESKMEGEILALNFFRQQGLPGVVFRPVGIYGPGDTRFLKLFRFIKQGRFHMFGSGEVLYHLTYIDDLINGILLLGKTPKIEGEIFTLAGDQYTTLNELVRIIGQILGVEVSRRHFPVWPLWTAGAVCEFLSKPFGFNPPIYRRRVDFFIKDRAFNIQKAKKLLGYQPKVTLQEGLKHTANWYQQNLSLIHI